MHTEKFTQTFLLSAELDFADLLAVQSEYSFSIMEQSTRHVQKALVVMVSASAFAYIFFYSLQILRRSNEKRHAQASASPCEPCPKLPAFPGRVPERGWPDQAADPKNGKAGRKEAGKYEDNVLKAGAASDKKGTNPSGLKAEAKPPKSHPLQNLQVVVEVVPDAVMKAN